MNVKYKYVNGKAYVTFYFLAIAIFVLSVTVCKFITFELLIVLDLNLWPLNWRSKTLTIWIKWQTNDTCEHACAKKLALLGPAVCSQYNHDFDENWPANVPGQHTHVWIFWATVISTNHGRLNVLSGCGVHFVTDGWTDLMLAKTYIVQSVGTM